MNTTGYETCGNGYFQKLDEETYDTIWNYVGNKQMLKMKKASETEKGGIDMRCAIDEIYEDGLAEGEKRGIAGMLDLLKELGCSANDDVKREDMCWVSAQNQMLKTKIAAPTSGSYFVDRVFIWDLYRKLSYSVNSSG